MRQIKEIRAGMGPRNDLNIFHDEKYDTLGHNPILLGRKGDSKLKKQYARDMMNNQTRLQDKHLIKQVSKKASKDHKKAQVRNQKQD